MKPDTPHPLQPTQPPHPCNPIHPLHAISRRSLLGLALGSLAGCGGGGTGTNTAGLPGTGGTGVTSFGSISAFGSVVINGIHYDETAARISINGVDVLPSALRLGMVATVEGTRDAATLLGTANRIDVWSIAQAAIAQVTVQGGVAQIGLANLSITADANTVLDGVSSLLALAPGTAMAVWGLQTNSSATQWRATRLMLAAGTDFVTTGLFAQQGGIATVNGIALQGAVPSSWATGQLVRAQGTLNRSGTVLQLAALTTQDWASALPSGREIEIEGVLSAAPVNGRFMVGSVTVDGSGLAVTAQLTQGMTVEVKGMVTGSVLRASQIEVEDEVKTKSVEIEARIEQFTSLSNFVVRGQRCDASGAGIQGGSARDLRVGLKIKVKGTLAGSTLMVSQIEIDD